jgi:pectinesterase
MGREMAQGDLTLMRRLVFIAVGFAIAGSAFAAPDAVVAADGSGQYRSVQDAINAAPQLTSPAAPHWEIFVKAGTYHELVYVQREKRFISLVGEDAGKTVVAYDRFANQPGPDGKAIGTFHTPTVQIDADDFTVENLTLANTAGPVGQALALRVDGDRDVFRHCRLLGWQDTLLVNRGRHYFADCYIEGHVDFIFGGATDFFERCRIHCLRDGYITAASTPDSQPYGFVFADCQITGAPGVQTYLGRPWRDFAATVFLRTEMPDVVRPAGWNNWNKPQAEKTARYLEFASFGPGAKPTARVGWVKPAGSGAAASFTPAIVLAGVDGWNPARAPTLHLAGDSTMADKADLDFPERGWGQLLRDDVRPPWRLVNHAVNGRSTKSFRDSGQWQKVLDQTRPGDWVLIQFGHNDEKKNDPARYADPEKDYPANLREFVRDVRARGAFPILATPVVRRDWSESGQLADTHGPYLTAVRSVAASEKVPLLEMEGATRALVTELGPEGSKKLYVNFAPGENSRLPEGRIDNTHFTEAGARRVAALAVAEMRRLKLPVTEAFGDAPLPPADGDVRTAMRRVFDFQLGHPLPVTPGQVDGPQGWINAAFYTGVTAAARATHDPAYHDAAVRWSEAAHWEPGPRPRHADDQCCAQTYLELFLADGGPEKIAAFRRNADAMLADPKPGRVDWWWCDSLYMAPPAFARLAQATGDARYRAFMDKMYWDTVAFLFDEQDSLFFRDEHFLPGRPDAEGRKIFWSRGNGWVFAGLTRILDYIPADDPIRPRYVALFQKMAGKLRTLQQPDGFWPSDLLEPGKYPGPESSGTAFFAAGLAWGINHGLLDRAKYESAVFRAWRSLNSVVSPEGRLGYVQPVGFKPGPAGPDDTKPYAAGAYLLLGSELLSGAGWPLHEN